MSWLAVNVSSLRFGYYFWTRASDGTRSLAQVGSLDEAIPILHETDSVIVRYISAPTWRLQRLLLIQRLRRAGRNAEADHVEEEFSTPGKQSVSAVSPVGKKKPPL